MEVSVRLPYLFVHEPPHSTRAVCCYNSAVLYAQTTVPFSTLQLSSLRLSPIKLSNDTLSHINTVLVTALLESIDQ